MMLSPFGRLALPVGARLSRPRGVFARLVTLNTRGRDNTENGVDEQVGLAG